MKRATAVIGQIGYAYRNSYYQRQRPGRDQWHRRFDPEQCKSKAVQDQEEVVKGNE